MMTGTTTARLVGLGLLAVASAGMLRPGRAEAQPIVFRVVTVNCAVAGQTINNALRRQIVGQGLLVRVSGTCNEHVDIFRDDVIVRGNPTATINGPTTTDSTVTIDNARRVSLESLTISGGQDGVNIRGAWVTLDTVTVQGAARLGVVASFGSQVFIDGAVIRQSGSTGLTVSNASTGVITSSTVEQNNGSGINALRSSHLRVGQDAQGSATLGPVIVQGNTGSGITVNDSSAGIIVATTIQNNTSNGIYIARGSHADVGIGSFNVLGANTIQNNAPTGTNSGILVEGASANIIGNTITGNGFGVQFLNGGNGRLGIRPDATAYVGNTITGNRLHGVLINTGTAVIGGNTIGGNGTSNLVGSRSGVFLSQGSVNFIGHNTIENHADTGIFVRQGSLFLGNGFAALDITGNIIRNNGCGAEATSNRAGVFLFEGSTAEIRSTTFTANCGFNLQLFLGNVADVRGSTLSGVVPIPGAAPPVPVGVLVGTRGVLRIGQATVIENNPGDAVQINNGASFEVRGDVASTIQNNGGFALNCFGGESSFAVPGGAVAPIFTGNLAGNIAPSCTGF